MVDARALRLLAISGQTDIPGQRVLQTSVISSQDSPISVHPPWRGQEPSSPLPGGALHAKIWRSFTRLLQLINEQLRLDDVHYLRGGRQGFLFQSPSDGRGESPALSQIKPERTWRLVATRRSPSSNRPGSPEYYAHRSIPRAGSGRCWKGQRKIRRLRAHGEDDGFLWTAVTLLNSKVPGAGLYITIS